MDRCQLTRVALLSAAVAIIALLFQACAGMGGARKSEVKRRQTGGSIQRAPRSLTGATSSIAGIPPVLLRDGTGMEARFFRASGITTDGSNIYVVEFGISTIRKVA